MMFGSSLMNPVDVERDQCGIDRGAGKKPAEHRHPPGLVAEGQDTQGEVRW